MKKHVWLTPNKMLFESGHKTFDRQTSCISTGNVIANTQTGFFVRPYMATECGGITRPKGHLRDYDLEKWDEWGLPAGIRRAVIRLTETQSVILYRFHHWNNRQRIIHGYVVTTPNHRLLDSFVTGPTYKSALVIAEAIKYVSEKGDSSCPSSS